MTTLAPVDDPAVGSSDSDSDVPDIAHWTCCHDDTVALCGHEVIGVAADPGDAECVECASLVRRNHCPHFARCIQDVRQQ